MAYTDYKQSLIDKDRVFEILNWADPLEEKINAIKKLPVIQSIHSHWVVVPFIHGNLIECANCGYETEVSYSSYGEEIKICPHCHAFMDQPFECSRGINMGN